MPPNSTSHSPPAKLLSGRRHASCTLGPRPGALSFGNKLKQHHYVFDVIVVVAVTSPRRAIAFLADETRLGGEAIERISVNVGLPTGST